MDKDRQYVIGIDYGTDSVRSVIVDTTGNSLAESVFHYPRWAKGLYSNASESRFRHHPLDYLEGLESTLRDVLTQVPSSVVANVKAIAVDSTGSTPVAVDKSGTPLAFFDEFRENPNAMFVLWKDHTAIAEAEEINHLARTWGGPDYTKYCGGIYSSEWFWAKIMHILRQDEDVRKAAYSWVELCDWVPYVLTGLNDVHQLKRSRCAAGHKALWHSEFGGLPSEEFLTQLDPFLAGLRDRLYTDTFTSDQPAGVISEEWSLKLGLPRDVVVAVGAFDAHMGAVGGGIEPYYLCRVMGTSTCDMLVAPVEDVGNNIVRGICGQVEGSVIPGLMGLEAGQSAFGDVYAWFRNVLSWPLRELLAKDTSLNTTEKELLLKRISEGIIPALSEAASAIPVTVHDSVALDWLNGRRTPDANQKVKSRLDGLDLGTDAPQIFKALVEATCFGARSIAERFNAEGTPIRGVIGMGGVARKSPYVMQTLANVLQMPIRISAADQACALGAAMFGATAAGLFPKVEDAMKSMSAGFEMEYLPNAGLRDVYDTLYRRYVSLGAEAEAAIEAIPTEGGFA